MTLPERLIELHRAFAAAGVPHAFGGAIALAYCTREPRGTVDIDVNVFLPAAKAPVALAALPPGVAQPPSTAAAIARDGQVRLWWDETPIDLFFDYAPIHAAAARHAAAVPYGDTTIPVLAALELAVFKIMFDRTQDWADIEKIVATGELDLGAVRAALLTMLGDDDPRSARLDDAVRRARAG